MFFATNIHTGQRVAIKKLQIMRKGKNRLFVILNEVNVLAQSQHPNIIQYVGTYEFGEELWVRALNLKFRISILTWQQVN